MTAQANGNTASAQFENNRQNLFHVLERNKKQIERVATTHLGVERLTNLVYGELRRTPKLVLCTPGSVAASVIQAARLGLEIGGLLGRCWLVPYYRTKNGKSWHECQLILGYKGMIELAYRSNQVTSVEANVVYQGDVWKYREGINRVLDHVPTGEDDPALITHAYAIVRLRNGGVVVKVLNRAVIDKVKDASPAGQDGPWVTHYAEMAMKTAVRRGFKFSPSSAEMALAVAMEEMGEAGFSPEEMLDEPLAGAEAQEPAQEAEQEMRSAAIVPVRPRSRLDNLMEDETPEPPAHGPRIKMPGGGYYNPGANEHPNAPGKR